MDVNSSPERNHLTPHDRIIQRLAHLGIPEEDLKQPHLDLVAHVKSNTFVIDELVSAILPPDKEVVEAILEGQEESEGSMFGSNVEDIFHESMIWLQWLMFEGDASTALEQLGEVDGQRGVCGAVWGNNDIAYRCRTCEHDPTCAICVPCFQNGNHKDHDYSIIYTGGGCCDCGDVTAWKREGFCSKHRGAEQIQPLPEKFSNSMEPVLDSLLRFWKKKILFAESIYQQSPQVDDRATDLKNVADELTSSVVEMLLEFCKQSESLLSFISHRVFSAVGLLDILVRAERLLNDDVVQKLHELLLKFLGEPQFKYEFAKVFLSYYPVVVKDAVKENSDSVLKKFGLLSTFSVQILTVPTLTPRLVKEMNFLSILFDCLGAIFSSCAGEDNKLQVNKWGNLYETTIRVVEDIRFVMSHSEVPKYVTHDRRDILRTWMRLLSFVQGMNPQKRETGIHLEEENEYMHLPFVLCHSMANIHSLLVAGAFTDSVNEDEQDESMIILEQEFEDQDSVRHSKVGRLSEESSVSSVSGRNASDHAAKASEVKYCYNPLPSSAVWLTFECLKALENWLQVDNTSGALVNVLSPKMSYSSGNNLLTLRRTLSKFRRGGRSNDQEPASGDYRPDAKHTTELEALRVLNLSDWPEIGFDVSSQEISVHTPLHRLLSIILQRAFKMCYDGSPTSTTSNSYSADPLPAGCHDFFGHILGGYHPHGFSAFLMEHPLRLRVFCAEVHAGMWRRNGDGAVLSSEWYRSVRWSEQGLEFDLFLLQCCAALAPADVYVQRILERFGLSKYLSLNIDWSSEYEPILVHEMLILIIQIIKERRFSGYSTAECLQRELVYKLSICNAPRSQLVKSLPRDLSKEGKLQEILDAVADYSNPSGGNQGMYKLKTQYWKELDLYHPRWNPRDFQIAEERFLRACNCSALVNQLPKWPKIYHPLRGVARIATCKTTAQIVLAVLFYAVFPEKSTASRGSDGVVIAALHLLSLALDVCYVQKKSDDHLCQVDDVIPLLVFAGEERAMNRHGDQSMLSLLVLLLRIHQKQSANNLREASNYNFSSLIENMLKKFAELDSKCMMKLQNLAPDVVSQVVEEGERSQMHLESDADKHKAKARERQAAMLEKMKAQQSKFLASIDSSLEDDMDDRELEKETSCSDFANSPKVASQVICSLCHDPNSKSPVTYLVLLQKSRLLSFIDRETPTWDQGLRSEKELASTSSNTIEVSSLSRNSSQSSEVFSPKMFHLIQHAVNQFAAQGQSGELKAIMEYIKARFPSSNLAMPHTDAHFEPKTAPSVESLEEDIHSMVLEEMHKCLPSADFSKKFERLPYIRDSEAVDSDTDSLFLAKYIAALAKETVENASGSNNPDGRSQSEGNLLLPEFDVTVPYGCDGILLTSCGHSVHQECLDRYVLSLKERHTRRIVFEGGNVVDPDQGEVLCPVCRGLSNSVLPASSLKSDIVPVTRQLDSVGSLSFLNGGKSLQLQEALCLLQSAAKVAGRNEVVRSYPVQCPGKMKLNLDPVSRVLGGMYVLGKDKLTGSCSLGQSSLMLWDTLKYSLISTELASRSRNSSLAPNYSLSALYKDLKSSNCFILSLLLDIVQRVRTTNSLNSLLRLKGIQHFAQSICFSVPLDKIPEPGYVQQILEKCGTETQRRDTRLWRRASDPVIARDAFSSFMWILFCLPSPFMMSEESFLSLVHMFYVVTITQAAITYNRKQGWCATDIGYQDCVFSDIYKFMVEYEVGMQYFESNYIDSSKDMKDSIRSLSFPYLRKCALLWKLIKSSQPAPFSDGTQGSVESIWMGDDSTEFTNNAGEELVEIAKLEKIFKIPSLDVVSKDGLLRSVVRGWLHHFSKELEPRPLARTLYVTPAVPLRLMLLPQVYQDLLQRYIKQRCPDCGLVQDDPVLCLVCGKLCSSIRKACCRGNGCQTHALSCGAGTGVFLLIRRTTVLLQRSGRQAPWPSPYLDSFGEEDIDMSRGKPLYLNEERYAALTHMVASHGLDRSSRVLRQTTIGGFFII